MNSWLYRRKFIQLPVRIKELKEKGYNITSNRNEDTSVNYVLNAPRPTLTPKKSTLVPEYYKEDGFDKVRYVLGEPEQLSI